ncbi:porphobilinogen deaminase, dipyromethane cofactor binding domain-containing protein [Zopfochytrium polystomum]|nr:porphobilinogen deaminase, dipyromethane cofactor binding domain-containing protein [Zopfochytrium polystomum]
MAAHTLSSAVSTATPSTSSSSSSSSSVAAGSNSAASDGSVQQPPRSVVDLAAVGSGSLQASAASSSSRSSFVIGSRESELAMIQTRHVHALLRAAFPNATFSILGMTTKGDQVLDVALSKIGSKSLFTKELEIALHDRRVDLVVHSLKDLPTTLPEGMAIGAILEREDPRDAVVVAQRLVKAGKPHPTLDSFLPGSVVGTSSVRRSAQLKRKFPHLVFQDVRGNLNTRLKKLDAADSPYCALLLAHAGLSRMGWAHRVSQILQPETIYYAVGQGALAIEVRADDAVVLKMVKTLQHRDTFLRCSAERAFMRELEGGCSVPLGVFSEIVSLDGGVAEADNGQPPSTDQRTLHLRGSVTSLDGVTQVEGKASVVIRRSGRKGSGGEGAVARKASAAGSASDDEEVDAANAESLGVALARQLIEDGARDILAAIRK